MKKVLSDRSEYKEEQGVEVVAAVVVLVDIQHAGGKRASRGVL